MAGWGWDWGGVELGVRGEWGWELGGSGAASCGGEVGLGVGGWGMEWG